MKIRINSKIRSRLNVIANASGCDTVHHDAVSATKPALGLAAFWTLRNKYSEPVQSECLDRNNPIWDELNVIARDQELWT